MPNSKNPCILKYQNAGIFLYPKGKWLKGRQKLNELCGLSATNPLSQAELDILIAKWKQENPELADITITYVQNGTTWTIRASYSSWSDDNVSSIQAK